MWVAPKLLGPLRASGRRRRRAMIVAAPARRAPAIAASPTPPQPNTATESPRATSPVFIAAPSPAITPQPSRPAAVGRRLRVDLRALAGGDERLLGERADAERRATARCRRRASSSGWRCGWRSSTTAGRGGRPGSAPHTARQLRITKSPGATSVTPAPTASTTPAASWPSRNGKSSLMPPSR